MKNSIAERISQFLNDYRPFNELSFDDLLVISTSINVITLEKNEILFQINDTLHDSFYVVASGTIKLLTIVDSEEILLNKCLHGDTFGLRPFFAKNNYMMTAKADTNCIVYAIPISVFRPFIAQNSEVLDFLLQSFASTAQVNKQGNNSIKDTVGYADNQSEIQFFQTFDYNKNPILILPDDTVQQVAQTMTDNLYGCAIVHQNKLPLGIITDVELRLKIATGKFYITTFSKNIMSSVVTVPENISLAEAQLYLLQKNVTHLCVTKDGSENTSIQGVISQHDLIAAQANNPGILIKEIKRATNVTALIQLRLQLSEFIRVSLEKRIPISHISTIVGDINLAFFRRTIDLVILEIGSEPARFAWLCIGSQGRKEQLLPTDQDNFLVFEDVATDKYQSVKEYFLKLSKLVNQNIAAIGYSECLNGNNAKNIFWCKSLSDWNNQFASWINSPGEKSDENCNIFFDFEIAYGEIKIEDILANTIMENAKGKKKFFAFIANDALKKPAALNFFKNFTTEEDGLYKDFFDIKQKAIMPFVDIARVLTLHQGLKGINNTYLRYKQLAILEPKYAEVYNESADSFLTLSKIRTQEGIKNNDNGQFIDIEKMAKSDKEKLKQSIEPLKDLEDIVKNKFSLTYFS